ncbi:hypothetical protein [Nocardia jiangsuensis]|uniref:Immunity protein 7 of polymorphic toxin system n=1 Tax=Nocardia jiangsuensis TaxID=1691563 RepID=A0ABV8E1M7_9NOCA
MDEKTENFLLYAIADDWTPLNDFDVLVARLEPDNYSRAYVLDVMRDLGERGLIRFGSFTAPVRPWTAWDVPVAESIARVANGYNGEPGYLQIADGEIYVNEVLRAEITEAGLARLRQLGDPYDKYGDPWIDDPYSRADP